MTKIRDTNPLYSITDNIINTNNIISSEIISEGKNGEPPKPPDKPKTKEKKFKYSSEDMELAEKIEELVLIVSPYATPNLESWADTIRKMREIDKIPLSEIERVFKWANQDSFWCANILSADKLREQFPSLDAKSRKKQVQKNKTGNTAYVAIPDAYNEEAEKNKQKLDRYLKGGNE